MPRYRILKGLSVELDNGVALIASDPQRTEGVASASQRHTDLVNAGYLSIVDPDAEPPALPPHREQVYVRSDTGALESTDGDGSFTPVVGSDHIDVDAQIGATDDAKWQAAVAAAIAGGIRRIVTRKAAPVFAASVDVAGLQNCVLEGLGQDTTTITGTGNFPAFTTTGACSGLTWVNIGAKGSHVDDATGPRRSRTTTGNGLTNLLLLEGDLSAPLGVPAVAYQVKDIKVRSCKVVGTTGLPILLKGVRGIAKISDCDIYNCLDTGFTFCEHAIFNNNTVRKSADNGVSISRGCQKVVCVGNDIDGSAYNGIWVSGFNGDLAPTKLLVSANNVTNTGIVGIQAKDAPKGGAIVGNYIDGVQRGPSDETNDLAGLGIKVSGFNDLTAVWTSYAERVTVRGNTILNAARGGIFTRASKWCTIEDNDITDCGSEFLVDGTTAIASSSTSQNFGVAVDNAYANTVSDLSVRRNRVVDTRATPFCNRAIYTTGAVRPYEAGNSGLNMRAPQIDPATLRINDTLATVNVANSAAEADLYRFTLPARTARIDDLFELELFGDLLNNSGGAVTFTWRMYIGTTAYLLSAALSQSSQAPRRLWRARFLIAIASLTTQRITGDLDVGGTDSASLAVLGAATTRLVAARTGGAKDLTVDQDIALTVQMGTAAATADVNLFGAHLRRTPA